MQHKDTFSFLTDLDQELRYGEHRLRLKEELTAHIEDATYERMVNGVSEDSARQESFTQLGTAHEVAQSYNTYMKYRNPLALYTNSLLIGVTTGMLYYILSFILPRFASSFLFLCIITIIGLILVILFYSIAYHNLVDFIENKKQTIHVFLITLIIPTIIFVYFITQRVENIFRLVLNITYLTNLLGNYLILYFYQKENSLLHKIRRIAQQTLLRNTALVTKIFITILGVGLIIYGVTAPYETIYRTIARTALQLLTMVFIHYSSSFNPYSIIILGIVTLGVIGLCCYGILRDLQRFRQGTTHYVPTFKILAAACLISIFFLPTLSLEKTDPINWQTPATSISTELLKRQTKIFYPLVDILFGYSADDSERIFYSLAGGGSELYFSQDGVRTIAVKDITSVHNFHFEGNFFGRDANAHPGIIPPPSAWEHDSRLHCSNLAEIPGDPGPYDYVECTSFAFKDKIIFSDERPVTIVDAKVSTDEKWLLLIRAGHKKNQEVYLISLQK